MKDGIEFRNVTFAYVPGKNVLNGINLKIPRGQKVALVGESGGGKTTYLRAIANAVLLFLSGCPLLRRAGGLDHDRRHRHQEVHAEVPPAAYRLRLPGQLPLLRYGQGQRRAREFRYNGR